MLGKTCLTGSAMEREAGTKVSEEARASRHRLFQGGARKPADSLGLRKRPERCEAEGGVTPLPIFPGMKLYSQVCSVSGPTHSCLWSLPLQTLTLRVCAYR